MHLMGSEGFSLYYELPKPDKTITEDRDQQQLVQLNQPLKEKLSKIRQKTQQN